MTNKPEPITKTGYQLSFYVTEELHNKLELLRQKRGKRATISDVSRDALRNYVDQQENIIGSRAHFNKTVREYLNEMETRLHQEMEQLTTKFTNLMLLKPNQNNDQGTVLSTEL